MKYNKNETCDNLLLNKNLKGKACRSYDGEVIPFLKLPPQNSCVTSKAKGPFYGIPNGPFAFEFIFLVDRSGSMGGEFIKSARETLILFLKIFRNKISVSRALLMNSPPMLPLRSTRKMNSKAKGPLGIP